MQIKNKISYTTWLSGEALRRLDALSEETGLKKNEIMERAIMAVKVNVSVTVDRRLPGLPTRVKGGAVSNPNASKVADRDGNGRDGF